MLVVFVVSVMIEMPTRLPFAVRVSMLKLALLALCLSLLLSSTTPILSVVLLDARESVLCADLTGVDSFGDSKLDSIVDFHATGSFATLFSANIFLREAFAQRDIFSSPFWIKS